VPKGEAFAGMEQVVVVVVVAVVDVVVLSFWFCGLEAHLSWLSE
jgi:hypothetical protein